MHQGVVHTRAEGERKGERAGKGEIAREREREKERDCGGGGNQLRVLGWLMRGAASANLYRDTPVMRMPNTVS